MNVTIAVVYQNMIGVSLIERTHLRKFGTPATSLSSSIGIACMLVNNAHPKASYHI